MINRFKQVITNNKLVLVLILLFYQKKKLGSACKKTLEAAKEALSKIEGADTVYAILTKPRIPMRNNRFNCEVDYFPPTEKETPYLNTFAYMSVTKAPVIGRNLLGIAKSPKKFVEFCTSFVEKGRIEFEKNKN